MKIYLDDERDPKNGGNWIIVRTVDKFKRIYSKYKNEISLISLDHDLGTDRDKGMENTRNQYSYR